LPCSLAFQFIGEKNQNQGSTEAQEDQGLIDSIPRSELEKHISLFDLRRLDSYSKNMVDFHLVLDLVPTIAKLFFNKQTLPKGTVNLSYVQAAILIGLGLQYKKIEDIEVDLGLNSAQILPQFNKLMKKFTKVIKSVIERDIEKTLDEESKAKQLEAKSKITVAANLPATEGESQGPSLLKKMKDDKSDFLKKHSVKHVEESTIATALKGMTAIPSTISLPVGKREAEEDTEELEKEAQPLKGKRGKKVRRS